MLRSLWMNRSLRPYVLLLAMVLALALTGGKSVLTMATAYGVLQHFATLGPVALALGLTILVRNFDLSVGGVVGLAGCVAILVGGSNPLLGLVAGVGVGAAFGLVQSTIIVRLNLSSIGVTLGGLLTATGLAYVVTGNQEVVFAHMHIPALLDRPVLGPGSLRFLVAAGLFAIAAVIISFTRVGRDVLAVGSDPKAAVVAGVRVGTVITVVFVLAGACTALSGSLLSYSLAAASPLPLSNTLVPAAAAAIIGGVSLRGGRGHPVGIAGGVLVLSTLQSGLTALGVDPFAQDVITGSVLLAVGISDGLDLKRRVNDVKRRFGLGPFRTGGHEA